jgi:hypothetical protein
MTDTPRTKDELLADFADQQNHGITPQKMRNMVVSVKDAPWQHFMTFVAFKDNTTSLLTLPNNGSGYGAPTLMPLDIANVPAGAAVQYSGISRIDGAYALEAADPRNAWGFDIPAGNAIMLPPESIWRYGVFATVKTADAWSVPAASPGPSFPFYAYIDQAEYDPLHSYPNADPTGSYIYEAYYNNLWSSVDSLVTNAAGKLNFWNASGTIANDKTTPAPFVLLGYTFPGWSTDVHLTQWGFNLWRVTT